MPANEKKHKEKDQNVSKGKHIKWTAVVLIVLIIFMIISLDQCYRAGDI